MQDDMSLPPRIFLLEEIEERGWSINQFAEQARLPVAELQAIFDGAPVTMRTAQGIGRAFGTSAEIWLNLQRLHDEDAGNTNAPAFG